MKRTLLASAIILTLLTLLVAGEFTQLSSANFFPDPGPDLPRIYIRSNGDVEPATAPIERLGSTYKLTGEITMKTIVIQRDNIVLDGFGHLIEGNESWTGLAPHFGDAGNNGIIITGRNNINITNLDIEKFTAGVRISSSSHVNIVGNGFSEEAAVFDTPAGIVIDASSHVLIENNSFTSIRGPAIFCNGTNITVKGNSLVDIIDGVDGSIALTGSSNMITDNQIEAASPSIRLGSADSNLIARNNITGDVSFVSCSNNVVFGNNLTSIRLIFSSKNTIFGNHMTNNLSLELDQGTANNTFYGNTFPINCSVRVNDAGSNFWDNGTIGNYWSDYNGTDSNRDGIGDSPYIITGVKWDNSIGGDVSFVAGYDNFPLMEPYDVEHDAVVLPQTEPFLTVLAAVAAVAVAVAIGAGLFLYLKRRKREAEQA
jgi:hypothetical protein